ncbi:MAG: hypothetical protein NTZ65_03755 [Candidatus Berkelbacteria bacterium]|nr:hypothetical protein [Candidatus Berkelbacteria bacterium]
MANDAEVHLKGWLSIANRIHPFCTEYLRRIQDFVAHGCPSLDTIPDPYTFPSEDELIARLGCLGTGVANYFPFVAKQFGGKTIDVVGGSKVLAGIHVDYAKSNDLDPLLDDVLGLLTIPIVLVVIDDSKYRNGVLKLVSSFQRRGCQIANQAIEAVGAMADHGVRHTAKYQRHRKRDPEKR